MKIFFKYCNPTESVVSRRVLEKDDIRSLSKTRPFLLREKCIIYSILKACCSKSLLDYLRVKEKFALLQTDSLISIVV